jgi:hypothetical protein
MRGNNHGGRRGNIRNIQQRGPVYNPSFKKNHFIQSSNLPNIHVQHHSKLSLLVNSPALSTISNVTKTYTPLINSPHLPSKQVVPKHTTTIPSTKMGLLKSSFPTKFEYVSTSPAITLKRKREGEDDSEDKEDVELRKYVRTNDGNREEAISPTLNKLDSQPSSILNLIACMTEVENAMNDYKASMKKFDDLVKEILEEDKNIS